jgi:protease I
MKIACILASHFEDSELRIPLDRLHAHGFAVDIIGAKKGDVLKGKKGKETVVVGHSIDDVEASDYDGLLIPGGGSPDQLRADKRFVDFVKDFDRQGKLIAAVCHGPQIFVQAELLDRKLTAWQTVQDDLRHMGADVVDQEVVADRNLITSRKPADLDAFADAILEYLGAGAGVGVPTI